MSLYENLTDGIIDREEYTRLKASFTARADEAEKQMRAGRIRYAEGRGEANARRALARVYTRQTGRAMLQHQLIYLPGTPTVIGAP